MLKRYIKQFYRRKIKVRKFFPTNNQLLEKKDEETHPIRNKLSENWDDIFKNHRELPPKEFQFSIGKQWKTLTDCSEGYRKVNNNSPTAFSEVDRKVNNNSPTEIQKVIISTKNENQEVFPSK